MNKKDSKAIDIDAIEKKIETHIQNVEDMKGEYKECYEKMKDLEKSITVEAGAIAAMRSLIYATETPAAEEPEGDK